MKLLGIFWNSIGNNIDEAISDIKNYSEIDKIYKIDLEENYKNFIKELYPFSTTELWKAEFKIQGLVDKYDDNNIYLIIMNMFEDDKVYLPQKQKYMYKNVLELKVKIRNKYRYLVNNNQLFGDKSINYDNVYHMTDDRKEYEDNLPTILKYLPLAGININLNDFVDEDIIKKESFGTRNKFWINNKIMYKEETLGSWESFSEVFNMHFMKKVGLNNCAFYQLAYYNDNRGVITYNVANNNEYIITGTAIMNYFGIFDRKDLIKNNTLYTLPTIINKYCKDNNLIYNSNIENEFQKLFIYDIITLQSDRNPSNWCIVVDENNNIRLSYYDNSNMLFFNKQSDIDLYKKDSNYLFKVIDDIIPTFLLSSPKEINDCFIPKKLFLDNFLKKTDGNYIDILLTMLDCITDKGINEILEKIEKENNIKLPIEFKTAVLNGLLYSKDNCLKIIKNYEKVKKI